MFIPVGQTDAFGVRWVIAEVQISVGLVLVKKNSQELMITADGGLGDGEKLVVGGNSVFPEQPLGFREHIGSGKQCQQEQGGVHGLRDVAAVNRLVQQIHRLFIKFSGVLVVPRNELMRPLASSR